MIASALRNSLKDGSLYKSLLQNSIAGIIVGIVALPLSMGLAIASGVPPQHGLYTAIIGGIFIALAGGSRVNISGPTAAFVVVLLPIVGQYGPGGLLISGLIAGFIMVGFGLLRLGRFIEVIPYPVIIGFTAGIGTVIAFIQLKDFLGLQPGTSGIHFLDKAGALVMALPTVRWQEAFIGIVTLAILILWKRINSRIPGYLVALVISGCITAIFNYLDYLPHVDTIASRFSYEINGQTGFGIPPVAPHWLLPWKLPGPDGEPIGLSIELIRTLFGTAFAIALLGALESLLCAVVADGMTGEQHNPDSEMIGQGLGNILVPFFGGIPVTAAIARTALNVRSGGSTPAAGVIHGIFILIAMVFFAPVLSLVPMASMAAILIMVAWNMSEARHALHIVRNAPRSDATVFLTCFGLTVILDMQIAVATGVALAAILFIQRMSELTNTGILKTPSHQHETARAKGVIIYDINGPLFFGAAHKALKVILSVDRNVHTVILDMADVALLDTTAMMNLESIASTLAKRNTSLHLINVSSRIADKMRRYGLFKAEKGLHLDRDLDSVFQNLDIHTETH
ncbi:MAG TPA: C4-dicarboxylic acid transporter DauA [Gammaproteobacteria bacterium]|nr:C4-dicarboxylic acid transporter DauA [Gammaproteobacteria bacterium]